MEGKAGREAEAVWMYGCSCSQKRLDRTVTTR